MAFNNDRKLVGSMWKKTSKKGNNFLSMALTDPEDPNRKFDLVVFKNDKKKSENSPDFFIFHSEKNGFTKKETKADDDDGFDI